MAIRIISFAEKISLAEIRDYSHDDGNGFYGTTGFNLADQPRGISGLVSPSIYTSSARYHVPLRVPATQDISAGFWWRVHYSGAFPNATDHSIASFAEEAEGIRYPEQLRWRVGTSGIYFHEGAFTTLLGSVTGLQFELEKWYHIWVRARIVGADLLVSLRVDGRLLAEDMVMSLNPFSGDIATFDIFTNGENIMEYFYHGIVIDTEGGWHGTTVVKTLFPNTQGTYDEWTPANSPGNINVAPPSVDEITGLEGDRSTYNFLDANLPSHEKIIAVMPGLYGRATGTIDVVPRLVRPTETDYIGDYFDVGASAVGNRPRYVNLYTDPWTGQPWTESGINDTEFGYEAATPESATP